jgi:hypothetical protein
MRFRATWFGLVVTACVVGFSLTTSAALGTPTMHTTSPPIDIELAVDTTGSMDDSIQNVRDLADKLVAGVLGVGANVRFSIVSFRDPHNPGGEYQVLQPMTTDAGALTSAIAQLHTVRNPWPQNVADESYNLVFHNSYSDSRTGWRADARKLVVVIGDAEPYGAGKAALAGCHSVNSDPDGFNTATELSAMQKAGRTLLMVRSASGATSVDLACYRTMAARAYIGGSAADDTSADDIGSAVLQLVQTSLAPIDTRVMPIFLGPRNSGHIDIRVRNPNGFPLTLQGITVSPPASIVAGVRLPRGWSASSDGTLSVGPERVLASGASYITSLTLRVPASAVAVPFGVSARIALPDGTLITPRTTTRLAFGHSFTVRVSTATGSRRLGTINLAFTQHKAALTRAAVKGFLSFGKAGRLRATFAAATLSQHAGSARLTLSGKWRRSLVCDQRTANVVLSLASSFSQQPAHGAYSYLPPCAKRLVHVGVNASVATR